MHPHLRSALLVLTPLLLPTVPIRADVQMKIEKMTFQIGTKPEGPRGATTPDPDHGNYVNRDAPETVVPDSVEVIKLNNGLVEAWVCPGYGARLLRAFDVKTGTDYFAWTGDRNIDYIGWGTGGAEPSFPFL